MAKYVKISGDIINMEAISHVCFLENRSGISDSIVIEVGSAEVIIDSGICGRAKMEAVREKLMRTLNPEDWDIVEEVDESKKAA